MIRWITSDLGTAPCEKLGNVSPGVHIIDVRDLVDKAGNTACQIRDKIQKAVELLDAGQRVIICCDHGISRSNAIAAGVLYKREGISFAEAVRRILLATSEKSIRIEVISAVEKAVAAQANEGLPRTNEHHILITGGTGAVGSALVPRLQKRYAVVSPKRQDLDLMGGSAHLDLFVKEHDIDTIVHLAHPRVFSLNAAMGESVVLLKNVLDVCVKNRLRLILPSCLEVYSGYRAKMLLASESLPKLPRGPFGESKYLCETLVEFYGRQFGLDCIIIRTGPVYGNGAGKPAFLLNFLKKALLGEDILTHKYRNGLPIVDLIHEDDLASAYERVIDSTASGDFNFGSGTGKTTAEIAEIFIASTNSKSVVRQQDIDDFNANVVMDSAKAREAFGWSPHIALEDGLLRLAKKHDLDSFV
ncbi:MAG: NAD-dependent epimerase/dehydratase family protein [Desulfobacterales bacterium]|nr:NAD-dependent epimerase/dehydratase family protein [Desulfobacterales bacterium]